MPGRGSACGPRLFMRYAQPPNVINNSPSARKRTYKMKSEISTLSELDRVFHSRKQTIMRKAVELEEATGSTVTVTVHSPNGETYYYATEGWALRALKNSGLIKENVISVSKHSLTRSINQIVANRTNVNEQHGNNGKARQQERRVVSGRVAPMVVSNAPRRVLQQKKGSEHAVRHDLETNRVEPSGIVHQVVRGSPLSSAKKTSPKTVPSPGSMTKQSSVSPSEKLPSRKVTPTTSSINLVVDVAAAPTIATADDDDDDVSDESSSDSSDSDNSSSSSSSSDSDSSDKASVCSLSSPCPVDVDAAKSDQQTIHTPGQKPGRNFPPEASCPAMPLVEGRSSQDAQETAAKSSTASAECSRPGSRIPTITEFREKRELEFLLGKTSPAVPEKSNAPPVRSRDELQHGCNNTPEAMRGSDKTVSENPVRNSTAPPPFVPLQAAAKSTLPTPDVRQTKRASESDGHCSTQSTRTMSFGESLAKLEQNNAYEFFFVQPFQPNLKRSAESQPSSQPAKRPKPSASCSDVSVSGNKPPAIINAPSAAHYRGQKRQPTKSDQQPTGQRRHAPAAHPQVRRRLPLSEDRKNTNSFRTNHKFQSECNASSCSKGWQRDNKSQQENARAMRHGGCNTRQSESNAWRDSRAGANSSDLLARRCREYFEHKLSDSYLRSDHHFKKYVISNERQGGCSILQVLTSIPCFKDLACELRFSLAYDNQVKNFVVSSLQSSKTLHAYFSGKNGAYVRRR